MRIKRRRKKPEYKRESFSKKKNSIRGKFLFLSFLLIVAAFLLIYILYFSGYFFIRSIDININGEYLSKSRVSTVLETYRGKNIWRVHGFAMEEILKENVPEVSKLNLEKQYPDKLIVNIEAHEPAIVLRQEYHEPWYLLGLNGVVLSSFTPSSDIYASLMHMFTPVKTKELEMIAVTDLEEFDVESYDVDVTEKTEGIALGVAMDEHTVSSEEHEVKEVPMELAVGDQIMDGEDLLESLLLLDEFEDKVSLLLREVWFFPVEREIHLVVMDGWKIKFSFSRGLLDQLQDMIDTLTLINFASKEFYYIDLRVPGKVFVCRKRTCNR